MIKNEIFAMIHVPPEIVFQYIDSMANKFPVYSFLETRPFFFFRILFVDGFKAAKEAIKVDRDIEKNIMAIGDLMGPFKLMKRNSPEEYSFSLESFFFNCITGYKLDLIDGSTRLNLFLFNNDPKLKEKLWWVIMKPFHYVFSKKVLKNIKEYLEFP